MFRFTDEIVLFDRNEGKNPLVEERIICEFDMKARPKKTEGTYVGYDTPETDI